MIGKSGPNLAVTGAALLAALLACKRGPEDKTPIDPWERAREIVASDPKYCFDKKPEYCVKDPKFVDGVIQKVFDQHAKGGPPKTEGEIQKLERRLLTTYQFQHRGTELGRQRVTELISKRHAAPSVSQKGTRVEADYGLVPGSFEPHRQSFRFISGDKAPRGQWESKEVGAKLKSLMAEHPSATAVSLKVETRYGTNRKKWTYTYTPKAATLIVEEGAFSKWIAKDLTDVDAVADGTRSVATRDLEACSRKTGCSN